MASGGEKARRLAADKRIIVKAEHDDYININTGSDTKYCCVTGLVILPDSRLFITDYISNNIKKVDMKRSPVITRLALSTHPWDIAKISHNQVAVTLPHEKKVVFVQAADSMSVDRTLPVGGECWGVDYRNDKLAVSFRQPDQVKVLDLQGTLLHSITNRQGQALLNGPYYLTFGLDSNSLYVSNYCNHNVVCMNLDGTVVATYTDRDLRYPRKAVVDGNGHVYVCSQNTDSIHQLTPGCKKIKVLLTKADGLCWPYTVSYHGTENMLYVGMRDNNNVKVYKCVTEID